MFFLVFSGFASTSSRRANVSTPERRAQAGTIRSESAARSCAGLNGRLSTPPARLWQGPGILALVCVLALFLSIGAARAGEPLANRITERLCYPLSAKAMTLTAREITAYISAQNLAGYYRDIQGSDARAWFEKSSAGAVCRTPATSDLTLFFCAEVNRDGATLSRQPRRLCP